MTDRDEVFRRTGSYTGVPWSRQDDVDLKVALLSVQSQQEIADFLKRDLKEVVERIAYLAEKEDDLFPTDIAAS